MPLHLDTWPGKIAVVLALVGLRELVRLLSPKPGGAPNAPPGEGGGDDGAKWLIETLDSAAIAIGLVLFVIQPFLMQAFYIPSGSMEDTLRYQPVGDRLLVSKLIYRLRDPRFQEVVVFRAPDATNAVCASTEAPAESETDFIKRCIGTPGDVVYARDQQYYHNGHVIHEPYTKWDGAARYDMKIVEGQVYYRDRFGPGAPGQWRQGETKDAIEQTRIEHAPWAESRIPPGRFLMLGDHRSNSCDSHMWGFVPRENIVGKAVCVFWPPTRLGLLDHMSFHPRKPDAPALTTQSSLSP